MWQSKQFAGSLGGLDEGKRFLQDCLAQEAVTDDFCFELYVAVEEAFVNIVQHGLSSSADAIVELRLQVVAAVLQVEIIDPGLSFNPLLVADPDLERPVAERLAGGMGIYLLKQFIDEVDYLRRSNKNVLILRKKLAGSACS